MVSVSTHAHAIGSRWCLSPRTVVRCTPASACSDRPGSTSRAIPAGSSATRRRARWRACRPPPRRTSPMGARDSRPPVARWDRAARESRRPRRSPAAASHPTPRRRARSPRRSCAAILATRSRRRRCAGRGAPSAPVSSTCSGGDRGGTHRHQPARWGCPACTRCAASRTSASGKKSERVVSTDIVGAQRGSAPAPAGRARAATSSTRSISRALSSVIRAPAAHRLLDHRGASWSEPLTEISSGGTPAGERRVQLARAEGVAARPSACQHPPHRQREVGLDRGQHPHIAVWPCGSKRPSDRLPGCGSADLRRSRTAASQSARRSRPDRTAPAIGARLGRSVRHRSVPRSPPECTRVR